MISDVSVPLESLNFSELLVQWKVMKALGYKSMFDPEFRKEMRNPYRRFLYYRLVVTEESVDKKFLLESLKNLGEKLSFFSDPELYRNVKDEEKKHKMQDSKQREKILKEEKEKMDKAMDNYRKPDEAALEATRKLLSSAKPTRSFARR